MMDVAFISYDEPLAEQHYELVRQRVPLSNRLRVHGVKGIHRAHKLAGTIAKTEFVWIVDGDAEVVPEFNFELPDDLSANAVYVWRSINNCNGLVYGNGGVKLIPCKALTQLVDTTIDMTSSLGLEYKVVHIVSNRTIINQTPFLAFRAAFRECYKLNHSLIKNPDPATGRRRDTWLNPHSYSADCAYSYDILRGAAAALRPISDHLLINDFDWLTTQYESSSL
jgi:hypothetical protein